MNKTQTYLNAMKYIENNDNMTSDAIKNLLIWIVELEHNNDQLRSFLDAKTEL